MATPAVTYTFASNTLIKASEANTNFQDIIDFLTNEVIQKDASTAFTVIPSGPASDPTGSNQFTRKRYVDDKVAAIPSFATGFNSKVKRGSTTVMMSSGGDGTASKAVSIPGITSSWLVFAQVRQSGTYGAGVGVTVTSRSGTNVTFTAWTRSGSGLSATYTIDYVAISPT